MNINKLVPIDPPQAQVSHLVVPEDVDLLDAFLPCETRGGPSVPLHLFHFMSLDKVVGSEPTSGSFESISME